MKKLLMMIGAAALVCGAILPMAAKADTVEINGFTWTYTPNEATRTMTIDDVPTGADAKDFPWSLVITGVTYKVTSLSVTIKKQLTGKLTVPAHVTSISEYYCFQNNDFTAAIVEGGTSVNIPEGFLATCTNLRSAWFKAAGVNLKNLFSLSTGMKVALFGPASGGWSNKGYPFNSTTCSDCKFYYPGGSTRGWNSIWGMGGSGIEAIPYGAERDINLEVDEEEKTITATVTTASRLVSVLKSAPYFKSDFGLEVHISVTNAIDLSGVTITDEMVSGVTFDRLVFSATTQAQLNGILEAFPATTPIAIDPAGLTENMVIPDGYPNVYVKTVPGVTIRRTASGFMVIVK